MEDELMHFDQDVKPLFRERDRDSMRFAFDLWSLDDVATHADAILDRLEAGTTPCDGAWPALYRSSMPKVREPRASRVVDAVADPLTVRPLVDDVVAGYEDRSIGGGLPALVIAGIASQTLSGC
jgi:hypothetical protein